MRDFKVGRHSMRFMSNYGKRSVEAFKYISVFSFVFIRVYA